MVPAGKGFAQQRRFRLGSASMEMHVIARRYWALSHHKSMLYGTLNPDDNRFVGQT